MSAFQKHHDELEKHETMMGQTRGRLAVALDLLTDALALYNGLFHNIRIERRFAESLPPVRIDIEPMRRVVINLVDNAVEALGGGSAQADPAGGGPTPGLAAGRMAARRAGRAPGAPGARRSGAARPPPVPPS